MKWDYDGLFGGLPDRTNIGRNLLKHQQLCDSLLEQPSVLNVVDSYPIELLFPIRAGRTKQQIGKKGRDKGRWSIGMKLCWILNTYGLVMGWSYDTLNRFDTTFHGLVTAFKEEAVILADLGFRSKKDIPDNLKLCRKGTWNERMVVETTFSLLTVVCHAKKMFHRRLPQLEARFAYSAAMFNLLLTLARQHDSAAHSFKVKHCSIFFMIRTIGYITGLITFFIIQFVIHFQICLARSCSMMSLMRRSDKP